MSRTLFRRVKFQLKLLRQMKSLLQKQFFYFNKSLENSKFYNCLKLANITPVSKKVHVRQKITIEQIVFFLSFQIFLKGYLVDNF